MVEVRLHLDRFTPTAQRTVLTTAPLCCSHRLCYMELMQVTLRQKCFKPALHLLASRGRMYKLAWKNSPNFMTSWWVHGHSHQFIFVNPKPSSFFKFGPIGVKSVISAPHSSRPFQNTREPLTNGLHLLFTVYGVTISESPALRGPEGL